MGWKSTINITREKALSLIYENLDNLNDEDLAEILEIALGNDKHGYNYSIDSIEQNDDD